MLAIIIFFVLMGIKLFAALIFHGVQTKVNFYYTFIWKIIQIWLLYAAGLFDKIDW